ncbi:MAG: hypothetical protein ABI579_08315 [Candidatus Sumerlaeota bacterium]
MKSAGRLPWIIAGIVMLVSVSVCAAMVWRIAKAPAPVEEKIVATPAPAAPSPLATISGEAFLKLTRGNETLSGVQVSLYDRSLIGEIERLRGGASDAKQSADEIAERVKSLEECMKLKITAEKWAAWQQKVTQQRDDFEAKGYEQIQIYDPIQEQSVMLSWQRDRLNSEHRLDTIVQRCAVRSGEATDEIDKRLHKLGYVEGKLAELLDAEREKLAEAGSRAMEFPDVLARAQKSQQAYDDQLTDSHGRFSFKEVPRSVYTLVATYKDSYSNEVFHWVIPVNTAERGDRKVVLSQANTYQFDQPVQPTPGPKTSPTPKPDTLMPAMAKN